MKRPKKPKKPGPHDHLKPLLLDLINEHAARQARYKCDRDDPMLQIKRSASRELELFLLMVAGLLIQQSGDIIVAGMIQGRAQQYLPHLAEEYRQAQIDACYDTAQIDNSLYDQERGICTPAYVTDEYRAMLEKAGLKITANSSSRQHRPG